MWVVFKDPATGEITITAERRDDGGVYSGRCESYQIWTTAQSEDIKKRGYLEVGALLKYISYNNTLKQFTNQGAGFDTGQSG